MLGRFTTETHAMAPLHPDRHAAAPYTTTQDVTTRSKRALGHQVNIADQSSDLSANVLRLGPDRGADLRRDGLVMGDTTH
jgi:hypothetical protein